MGNCSTCTKKPDVEEPIVQIKLLFLGSNGSGKSTIINQCIWHSLLWTFKETYSEFELLQSFCIRQYPHMATQLPHSHAIKHITDQQCKLLVSGFGCRMHIPDDIMLNIKRYYQPNKVINCHTFQIWGSVYHLFEVNDLQSTGIDCYSQLIDYVDHIIYVVDTSACATQTRQQSLSLFEQLINNGQVIQKNHIIMLLNKFDLMNDTMHQAFEPYDAVKNQKNESFKLYHHFANGKSKDIMKKVFSDCEHIFGSHDSLH
eukprot:501648_1